MNPPLRIAVADDEADMRDFYSKVLARLGHEVIAVCATGRELVDRCLADMPDMIITDIRMPELNGLDAVQELSRERLLPVILISAHHEPDFVERACRDHILAYLVKPIKAADLEPVISLVMRRFREFQALHDEAANLRQALEDRKLIERAKGILMSRAGIDEQSAFRKLQKISTEKNQKMVEIARSIITADEVFH